MGTYLAVSEFNKCRKISIQNENISENEISEMMLKDGERLIKVKSDDLPDVNIEAWLWNEVTMSVDVDDYKIAPKIFDALDEVRKLNTSEIMEMGTDYLMIENAILQDNQPLINQMLVKIEAASYMAASKVRFILEKSGYKTLPK